MASVLKIKRSTVAGKRPTTANITTGELALNLADKRLFSSDGTVVFEIGANTHSLYVGTGGLSVGNGAFSFPTTDGSAGQILKTDGSGNLTWQNDNTGSGGTTAGFPFFKTGGTQDNISVAGGAFPFYKTDGSLDSIFVA